MYRNVLHNPKNRFYHLRSERMARHYSTKDFFRQMPNALLARNFEGREVFGDLDFFRHEGDQAGRVVRGVKVKGLCQK